MFTSASKATWGWRIRLLVLTILLLSAAVVTTTVSSGIASQPNAKGIGNSSHMYQQNRTVEAIVAATLTSLVPTFEAGRPTAMPTPLPTRTPLPSATPRPTRTPTPTLSIDEQVALTITAAWIDATTLDVWVGLSTDQSSQHAWLNSLPDEMRADSLQVADLIATIEESSRAVSSETYLGCGRVSGYAVVFRVRLYDRNGTVLTNRSFNGGNPSFPSTINSCADRYGSPPSSSEFREWISSYATRQS